MTHAFSVDVEDWYQGVGIPASRWDRFESRIRRSMGELLDLMAKHDVQATCFVLGKVAAEHPRLVRAIHDAGHEVASHGWVHRKVYDLTPEGFRRRLRRSVEVLEAVTGEAVAGYRAPYFSIAESSRWALDVLTEEGLRYDSSLHPIVHWRPTMRVAGRLPSALTTPQGRTLFEVPVSTFPLMGANLPVGGGAYMRLYPSALWRAALRRLANGRGERLSLYAHPWELDPEQPRLSSLSFPTNLTHYVNLRSTRAKLEGLFRAFSFAPYREVFSERIENDRVPADAW